MATFPTSLPRKPRALKVRKSYTFESPSFEIYFLLHCKNLFYSFNNPDLSPVPTVRFLPPLLPSPSPSPPPSLLLLPPRQGTYEADCHLECFNMEWSSLAAFKLWKAEEENEHTIELLLAKGVWDGDCYELGWIAHSTEVERIAVRNRNRNLLLLLHLQIPHCRFLFFSLSIPLPFNLLRTLLTTPHLQIPLPLLHLWIPWLRTLLRTLFTILDLLRNDCTWILLMCCIKSLIYHDSVCCVPSICIVRSVDSIVLIVIRTFIIVNMS